MQVFRETPTYRIPNSASNSHSHVLSKSLITTHSLAPHHSIRALPALGRAQQSEFCMALDGLAGALRLSPGPDDLPGVS
jgi:hypothetical protein